MHNPYLPRKTCSLLTSATRPAGWCAWRIGRRKAEAVAATSGRRLQAVCELLAVSAYLRACLHMWYIGSHITPSAGASPSRGR